MRFFAYPMFLIFRGFRVGLVSTAQQLADQQRVAHWRPAHGAEEDADFAFMFSTLEQAVSLAGHAVADAWLEVRHRDQDAMMQQFSGVTPNTSSQLLLGIGETAREHLA